MCKADGVQSSSATWGLMDSSSVIDSENTTITVPTTYSVSYTTFTPGVITTDGIAIKIANRTGTTGTLSVDLYNHTLSASVAGSEVTVNCSDVVDAITASVDGGWMFFKFSSPLTLLAANNYSVRIKTSSATQIVVFAGTAAFPSKFLRTTTAGNPAAGDDRFIMGEWTGAGAMTTRTVNPDETGSTDYGAQNSSVANPALCVSNGGSFIALTTASTAFTEKISGNVVVYNGGIIRIGTSGTRMPSSSSFTWTFDCGSNVEYGLNVRRKGEFTAYGHSKTRWTTLTADEAAAQTVIGVASTTGWQNSDVLVFAPTGTTLTQGETKTVSTVDSSTQVTLTAGLTNAHTGSGDVIGEVGNITCNVKIVGASQTLCTYIDFKDSSLGVLDNVTVQYYGSTTSSKRGVEIEHTNTASNSVTLNSCSFIDSFNSTGGVGCFAVTNTAFFYITNNVVLSSGASAVAITINGGATGTPTFDVSDNLLVAVTTGATGLSLASAYTGSSGTITDNRIAGYSTGVSVASTVTIDTVTNFSGFKIHSCSIGLSSTSGQKKTISNCDFVCQNASGVGTTNGDTTLISCNFYGNVSRGVALNLGTSLSGSLKLISCNFRGRTGFAQPIGVNVNSAMSHVPIAIFESCSFGETVAHTTADVSISQAFDGIAIFNSCTFASSTEFNSTVYASIDSNGYIGVQRSDNTDGDHKTYIKQGIITRDTTIYKTASPSLRITPKSATITCDTHLFPFRVPVNNGQTCTPTVYVRESESGDGAAYNGNRVKLYVRANYNLGITSNTLLDTATASSDGAWEGLAGTTATVTDDGILEFYVLCDGTTGWINVDDVTAIVT